MAKSEPAEIRVLLMNFTISRPQKEKKTQPGEEAACPSACAFDAFIGLRGQKCISKNSDLAWVEI
jgi:hypothetical protein